MKTLFFVFLCTVQSMAAKGDDAPPYHEGTKLNVFATSGLNLRAAPDAQADVLDIVRYGDQVTVVNTYQFSDEHRTRIGYVEGYWIQVAYQGVTGYIFDGYLSALPFPSSLDQLLDEGYSYAYTLEAYMDQNFTFESWIDSSASTQAYWLEPGIKVRKIIGSHDWQLTIELPDTRIHEFLHVMRSMVRDRKQRRQFNARLIFIEDDEGTIEEIKVQQDQPVTLRKLPNGNVLIRATGSPGC